MKINVIKILTICLCLIGTFSNKTLYSQELANYSSAFADIGFGARPLGMGGAYSALAQDVNAILWNPAGIVEVKEFEATLTYAKQFGLVPYSFGGVVYSFNPRFSMAGGAIISGDELMRETSIITNIATKFYLDEYLLNIGLSLTLLNASFGKNTQENSSVQGDALGYSAGLGVQLYLTDNIILASYFQNLANSINWNSSTVGKYSEGIPKKWTFGIGLKDFHQFNFGLDIQKSLYKEIDDKFFVGIERKLLDKIFLRAGAASSINQSERLFYSFGGGFKQTVQNNKNFQLDFAYIIHQLENMFRISLSFEIN
jgi:hypothetical protein